MFLVHRKQCFFLLHRQESVSSPQRTVFLSFTKTIKCSLCTVNTVLPVQKKESLFFVHRNHSVVSAKERNTVLYAHGTPPYLHKRKKHCFLCTRNTLFSVQMNEILFSIHKKHFVVYTKERNAVFCAQETLCCLGRRKKHCFLCTRNTLLSQQKKETLFPVHKKHFVVLAKDRNTISCAQETLCCLRKRKKHCFLCTRNTLLSRQMKETLFPVPKKHFVVLAKERALFPVHKKQFVVSEKERKTVSCAQEILCCLGKRKEHYFLCTRNTLLSWQKERNTVFYAQETLCCLGKKRKKHCFLCTRNTLLSQQMKETLFPVHKKHFVVLAKDRNTVFYAQETLCCLGKRKEHCFLCTRNTLLSWQKKETQFPVHKKHFVVLANERNTVFYAQETLCCLGKRKKHCFLCTRNTLLPWQKKEKLFPVHKKHFVVLAKERNERNTVFLCIRNNLLSQQER